MLTVLKSIPDPVSATTCELVVPELDKRSVPVRVPAVVGVKLTSTVQVPSAGIGLQLFLTAEKSPVTWAPLMLSVALLAFVTVTVRGLLAVPTGEDEKVTLEGLAMKGTGPLTPVPDRVTIWGLPWALSVMVRASMRLPETVGARVTVNVQYDAAATVVPQSSVSAKSGSMVLPLMVSPFEPILRRTVVCDGLVLPTFSEPNSSDQGPIAIAGASVFGSIFVTKVSVCPPHTLWKADWVTGKSTDCVTPVT